MSTTEITGRQEDWDIEINDDATTQRVVRVKYNRYATDHGVCPFCESADGVEWVDEVGPGGQYRKQRYECECGAHGESLWTWDAGTIPAETEQESNR